MQEKHLTHEQIALALKKVMYWDDDNDVLDAATLLGQGHSVLVDALSYIGNGKWERKNKKDRYRYKVIAPILDEYGDLYSTDLFSGDAKHAIAAKLGIYQATRQLVIEVVSGVQHAGELGHGYKDGKYGVYKLVLQPS